MICGLAGLVLCFVVVPSVVAIVLGIVAARRIRASGGRLTGLGAARAGWITGLVGVLAGIGFGIAALSGAFDDDEVSVFDLETGDCVDHEFVSETTRIESMTVVDCDEAHTGRVFHTGQLNPDRDLPYPDDETLFELIDAECQVRLDSPAVADDLGDDYFPLTFPIGPDEDAWSGSRGRFVCIVIRTDAFPED